VAKEFINPNWHVILIHYPLGVFVLGVVIELLSVFYRRGTLRVAGRWMILLGALLSIPTALSGVYALGNVARMDLPASVTNADIPWRDVVDKTQLNDHQWEHLRQHAWVQAGATALAVLLVVVGLGASDTWRRRLYFPLLLGLLFSLVAMLYGAWHGGEMVYRHGTGVLVNEAKGATPDASVPKPTESAADEQVEVKRKLEYFVPPLQLHVVLAGLAVAVALGALGLSFRAVNVNRDADDVADAERGLDQGERDMLYAPPVPRGPAAMDVVRSLNPDTDVTARPPRLPVSRLWLLAALVAVGASATGVWFLAGTDEARPWEPRRLWSMVKPTDDNKLPRRFLHVATGGVIIVTPLLLALVTRVSRRPRVSLTLLALLLLAAIALQAWLGVLLMLDTPRGPVTRFNTAGESPPPARAPETAPTTRPVSTTQGIATVDGLP
jgi:uncharacterized membrane protein